MIFRPVSHSRNRGLALLGWRWRWRWRDWRRNSRGLRTFAQIWANVRRLRFQVGPLALPLLRRRLQQLTHLQRHDRLLPGIQVPAVQVGAKTELHRVVALVPLQHHFLVGAVAGEQSVATIESAGLMGERGA